MTEPAEPTGRVLAVASNHGYWGVELAAPVLALQSAGYTVDLVTPRGERPIALPSSLDPDFVDPPLGKCVTTPEARELTRRLESGPWLDGAVDLRTLIPERPYHSAPDFLRRLEAYYRQVQVTGDRLTTEYDALLIAGGSGPIVDLVNNQRLHELVLGFARADKPIAAICYAVGVLVFARDFNERRSLIRGKHVTGHCIEYDYHDGTGFVGTDFIWARHRTSWSTCSRMPLRRTGSTTATSARRRRSSSTGPS
jgi:putative intracellular protease/amidase